MKKYLLISLSLLIACTAWFGFNRASLPEVPVICGELSKQVPLEFNVSQLNFTDIELSLASPTGDKDLFVWFQMTGPWKTGQPGLLMKSAEKNSKFKGGMSADKYKSEKSRQGKDKEDFGQFLKDKKGKDVQSYTFNQTIVEGESGEMFLKMTYQGAEVPMIQTLKLTNAITLPDHISKLFTENGQVVLQAGKYRFDDSINGFYIGLDAAAL